MPIRSHDVITLGYELAQQQNSEAALRAAVGRLYYGLFLLVRETFAFTPQRRNAHDQAAAELARRTKRATADQYRELLDLRGLADYEPDESEWDRKVSRAIRLHDHITDEMRKRQHIPRTYPRV